MENEEAQALGAGLSGRAAGCPPRPAQHPPRAPILNPPRITLVSVAGGAAGVLSELPGALPVRPGGSAADLSSLVGGVCACVCVCAWM